MFKWSRGSVTKYIQYDHLTHRAGNQTVMLLGVALVLTVTSHVSRTLDSLNHLSLNSSFFCYATSDDLWNCKFATRSIFRESNTLMNTNEIIWTSQKIGSVRRKNVTLVRSASNERETRTQRQNRTNLKAR
jgi:hypothetical protein